MTKNKTMRKADFDAMVGCTVHHLGHDWVVESHRSDMGMIRIVRAGAESLVRPSEIRS